MTTINSPEESVNSDQEKKEESIESSRTSNNISNENDNSTSSETNKSTNSDECKLSEEPTVETYTDHTGTDLMQFLTDTLQNNPKDRIHLFKIEKQLTDLVKDPKRNQHKFGPMSSYHRMLVHRVAAFFGMDHNVNSVDNSVIVSKTRTTRLPEFKFSEQIKNTTEPEPNELVKSIIKRDSSSLDKLSEKGCLKDKSPDRRGNNTLPLVESRRSKSLEEREEEYEKVRARIFNQDSTSSTENPSDTCANTSTTDDSVATSSSGIVVSTSATNSSPSCSHEDLKPGSNWPSIDSRLWSSTESEGSNRPRYLRLQRQKRLPDSFDSDSARTSFTTSSSMSSASGMFLTPDSCLVDQQIGDFSSNNRQTFTKASSFGGISVLSRDNTSGPASEPRLTKTASLNTPTFSDSLPRSSNHELHLWPKKQSKPSGNYFQHGNNQGTVNHGGQDSGNRTQIKSYHSGKKQDDIKSPIDPSSETIRNAVPFDQPSPLPVKTTSSSYGRSASEGSSNKQWMSNQHVQSHQPLPKGQSKYESHHGNSNVSRNQSNSSDRPKNFNSKDSGKTLIGPQIVINSVGGCMSQLPSHKSTVLAPDITPAQPYYHLPFIQKTPSVVVDPPNMSHDEINKNQSLSKPKYLPNQMAGLSINSQSRVRSSNDHYHGSSSGRNGHSSGRYGNIQSGDLGIVTSDVNYRTTGYALTPIPANLHSQKSVLPVNVSNTTAQIPLCYIHPSLQAPQPSLSHHNSRFANPGNQTGSLRIDASQGYTSERYMTTLSSGNSTAVNSQNQQIGRPPDTYSANVAPDMDIVCQSRQQPQNKSNLILLGSQLPVNTSNYNSYQPIPMQQSPIRVVPQVQSLVSSYQNQPQTNRMPNVPFNSISNVSASVPSSGPATVASSSNGTGQPISAPPQSVVCNNGMMNPSQTFPYAINHVSLPSAPNNSGQLATANLTYAPSMQVPPNVPMYVNTNGGAFASNQITGTRPMPPPPQAQMIPSPYSPQNPVYRPIPLFFVFNFQNKRSN
ncbi:cAMP-regulated phosphoprotein 21 isoform X2 [Tetranychus urticae]|uniref:cAMP-regulated phosphoprotein 21 isoform X2 n=1 Tax=Tetranychus urticae TaxID=32264 RepID=UPI00077C0079|nr:cAMP-regulated phosphoprotein 21 isoform X2 [Tetranychus urticae]